MDYIQCRALCFKFEKTLYFVLFKNTELLCYIICFVLSVKINCCVRMEHSEKLFVPILKILLLLLLLLLLLFN